MNDEPVLCVLGCHSPEGFPYPADRGYVTCEPCARRLWDTLADVVARFGVISLPAAAVPRPAPGARRAPGFGSRSPANDHVIAIRDHRSVRVGRGDPHSPLAILHGWAATIREERGHRPPPVATVETESGTIRFEWDWLRRQGWIADMAVELREVAGQLRWATGERGAKKIGVCRTVLQADDGTETLCGTPLYVPIYGDTVKCRGCRTEWVRDDWMKLGRALTQGVHLPQAS